MTTFPPLFGTDGIRGVANQFPMTPELGLALGRAVAHYFHATGPAPVLIGKDTRISGDMLEGAIVSGLLSAGANVILLGVLPTPGVAHLTRIWPAAAGIMISASHNPFTDNGIKIFQPNGYKCDDSMQAALEALILHPPAPHLLPTGSSLGGVTRFEQTHDRYFEMIRRAWPSRMDLHGFRIALDAANGAAYRTAPELLRLLGAEVFLFHHEPNGTNINLACGSTHPESIQTKTVATGAHLGVALDGDADRLICCDETGQIVDGDELMAILALDFLQRGELARQTLVATSQSNLGLDDCLRNAGGQVRRTAVGDRFVMAEMLAHDLNLGGEQSGHIIFRDLTTTSDGLLTALQIIRIMRTTGQPLSALRGVMKKYPQILLNLAVREKVPLPEIPEVQSAITAAEKMLGTQGRVMVRYSGTEKKVRILLEGPEKSQIESLAQVLAQAFRQTIAL